MSSWPDASQARTDWARSLAGPPTSRSRHRICFLGAYRAEPTVPGSSEAAHSARRAKLKRYAPRLVPLYDRARQVEACTRVEDAMALGHWVRELLDGLLLKAGQTLQLGDAVQDNKELRNGITSLRTMLEKAPPTNAESLRSQVLKALESFGVLDTPPDTAERFKPVAVSLGFETSKDPSDVATLAHRARGLASNALHIAEETREGAQILAARSAWESFGWFLDAMETDFTPRLQNLQAIIERANGEEPARPGDLDALRVTLRDADANRHFFLGLTRPAWLTTLQKAKLLEAPPSNSNLQRWWAGEYIINVAKQAPQLAVSTFLQLAGTASDPVIDSVGRRLALQIPGDAYSKPLHRRILAGVSSISGDTSGFRGYGHEAALLVPHLLRENQTGRGSHLFEALVEPRRIANDEGPFEVRRTVAALEYWDLSTMAKASVEAMGTQSSSALWNALVTSIERHLSIVYGDQANGRKRDRLFGGRRKWDEEDRGYEDTTQIILRTLYRESRRLINAGHQRRKVVDSMLARQWSSFQRLAYRLVADEVKGLEELALSLLLEPGRFEDGSIREDYAGLVNATAPYLTEAQRKQYCELVDRQINLHDLKREVDETRPGHGISEGRLQDEVARDRRNRLAPMQGYLPEPWRKSFDDSVARFGKPRFVYGDFELGDGGWVQPAKLAELNTDEILGQLRNADNSLEVRLEPFGDLYSGFSQAVQRRPDLLAPTFAAAVPPKWRGALLDGLTELARVPEVDANALLPSFRVVLADFDTSDDSLASSLIRAANELIKRPDVARSDVEACIIKIEEIAHRAADPEIDSEWDAVDIVINRTKTRALEAILEIQRRARADAPAHTWAGPAARESMLRLLEAWPPDSPALAALVGHRFSLLCFLDQPWALQLGTRLLRSQHARCRRAFWVSMIAWNPIYDIFVEAFDREYRAAFTEPAGEADRGRRHQYDEHLGQHAAAAWYRGLGTKETRHAIWDATPQLAQRILFDIGVSLKQTPAPGPQPLMEHIVTLVEHYMERAGRGELEMRSGALHILENQAHFTEDQRMRWHAAVLLHGKDVHVDEKMLQAIQSARDTCPDEAGRAFALALERSEHYVLRDILPSVAETLQWYAAHGALPVQTQMLKAVDTLVRRGMVGFQPVYEALKQAVLREEEYPATGNLVAPPAGPDKVGP